MIKGCTVALNRDWYVETIRHWILALEDRWDEELGYYHIPQSVRANGMLIPPLLVLVTEGETRWKARILRMAARMVQSPPYDERYRYFNWNMSQTGGEIHSAGSMTQVGLSFVLRYAQELGLAAELRQEISGKLHDSLERLAEFGRHADESEYGMAVEQDGTPVDIGKERAEKIAKGLPEDFGRLREIGPSNQTAWEMRACLYAWEATGESEYLDFTHLLWRRVLRSGGSIPYPACFAEDWSFVYNALSPLWNYKQTPYDSVMYWQYADCVRIMRRAKSSNSLIESFMMNWGNAVFTRSLMRDASNNMVFNSYGWERSYVTGTHGTALWMHPVIAVSDLTPYDSRTLKDLFERGVRRIREWDFRYPFPPDLGIKGWASGQEEDRAFCPYELALMLLDNPDAVDVVPEPPSSCISSFAWKEKNFVMQTPVYQATIVGTSPGYDGVHGIPTSGGEYVIRIPNGDYLFPLSDKGRTSLCASTDGLLISSAQITRYNADDWRFEMTVLLPDGTRVSRGTPYGPLLYDPKMAELAAEISFGNESIRLRREISFFPDRLLVKDSLTALRDVWVEQAYSRTPLITVNPRGELPLITGLSEGKRICIRPPFFMGLADSDYLHHDQEFIRSLKGLERLRIEYPRYGFEVLTRSSGELRLAITPWEWQENRRMRVDGKNLDCMWIWEPTWMKTNEERGFFYEIRPFSKGSPIGA